MTGREAVLARIRVALDERPAPPEVPRGYLMSGELDAAAVLELFVERVRDYRATVVVTDDPQRAAADALAAAGAHRVGVAPDLDAALRPRGFELPFPTLLVIPGASRNTLDPTNSPERY